ncbi:MAG: hypothetical protein ACT4QC_18250 [Planctomycetaceae bacterium]
MQNLLLALLSWTVRMLNRCRQRCGAALVLPGAAGTNILAGTFSLGVDVDSPRLDPVSRSLLWGAGAVLPRLVPAEVCPRRCASSAATRGRFRRRLRSPGP